MHKFNPTAFAARQAAKVDHDANQQTVPTPNSIPQIVARVKLLEQTLGL